MVLNIKGSIQGSKHEPQDTQGGLTGWAFKASMAEKFEDLLKLAFGGQICSAQEMSRP